MEEKRAVLASRVLSKAPSFGWRAKGCVVVVFLVVEGSFGWFLVVEQEEEDGGGGERERERERERKRLSFRRKRRREEEEG